jgi:proteasome lid subunit RPN8/RPN11
MTGNIGGGVQYPSSTGGMMFSKVKVSTGALNYFRKKSREACPLEIQAYLLGRIISVDEIEITKFLYTDNYAIQTNGSVCWYQEDLDKVRQQSIDTEQLVVGDIHSHPNWDAVMSPSDQSAAVVEGFSICGIVSINNNRTRVRFWTPTSALPCKIVYT